MAITMKKNKQTGEKSRFSMVKERHRETFETALSQGKVDEQMQPLCIFITGAKKYFTSSCCSGRIMLLEKRGESRKENLFHRKWHREVDEKEIIEGMEENVEGDLWFKLDPFILHIGCETARDANAALDAMRKAGVKRGGILVAQEGKWLIEMQGTQSMSFPIRLGGKQLADREYVRSILGKANSMLEKNYTMLARLEGEMRKALGEAK
ncbi:MAG TPA: hypothetical protein HA254_01465 [Candidatus Diapherotrites archaeon]|uniref:tRNA(Phe) 7-((3-amino-3-carboxypropyl)-4-demethylwyosine(37)-N(4))-methyltransferase n=1 Tax=Candidatus Iainarchaeum sp. TaxID=3101447 RepID=A0A7J4IZS7_9ARCH|nr:hypothetical protein [Candidatus Diapherotrites archaeon]